MALLEKEPNKFTRSDYPIARVAYEVYELRATLVAIFGGKLASKKLEDFIPKFVEAAQPEELTEEDQKAIQDQRAKDSQAIYMSLLRLNPDGTPMDERTPSEKVLASILEEANRGIPENEVNSKETQGREVDPRYKSALLREVVKVIKGKGKPKPKKKDE